MFNCKREWKNEAKIFKMQEGGDVQDIKYEEKTLNEIFENIKI